MILACDDIVKLLPSHPVGLGVNAKNLLDGARIRHAIRSQTHNTDAVGSEFCGKSPSEPFNGAHCRGEAAQQWNSGARRKR